MNFYERIKEVILHFNGIDDLFFPKLIEDPEVAEEILQVLLEDDDLRLQWVTAQKSLRNIASRSVTPDAMCMDYKNRFIVMEVQKSDNDDHQKRVRYVGSNVDTYFTEKGLRFQDIPDVYVIFIAKFDVFRKGEIIYHINRTVEETHETVHNGFHEIYINTDVTDNSKISQLMQYLLHTKGDHPMFPKLSARVRYLKNFQEGDHYMTKVLEDFVNEFAIEYAKNHVQDYAQDFADECVQKSLIETAQALKSEGLSFEMAIRILPDLTIEEIKKIYNHN